MVTNKIVKKAGLLLSGLIFLGFTNTGHAALIDIGDGLINDSTLNITWMKDANLFKTLCDAADPIATGFTPVDTADAATVCSNNGRMTWNDAEVWIARLNAQNYRGHNDWRQPLTPQPDASCETQTMVAGFPDQGLGFNCRGSELGHLFNISLGNPNDNGTGATGGTVGTGCFDTLPHCLQNSVPFDNAQSFAYWSGSTYAPDPSRAWLFVTDSGNQAHNLKGFNTFDFLLPVWPVRSGQTVVAPAAAQNIPTVSVGGWVLWHYC